MKLRDFELTLINEKTRSIIMNAPKGCDVATLSLDNTIYFKEKLRTFVLETRCITAMFARLLKNYTTKDCKKIVVECVSEVLGKQSKNFSGILNIQVEFDYEKFMLCDSDTKKSITLSTLMKAIEIIADENKWDMQPFFDVNNMIINNDYINEWIWKKSVKSPNKNYVAEVLISHRVSLVDIFIIIKDLKSTEIHRKKIISDLPSEWAYARYLGELKWVSDTAVTLVSTTKETSTTYYF